MKDAPATTIYLKDYAPPAYVIDRTDLAFDLFEDHADVRSILRFTANPAAAPNESLVLHGQDLELIELVLVSNTGERVVVDERQYIIADETLTIASLPALLGSDTSSFELRCHTRIEPQNNTALEGLYKSKKMFCTQCEAEGFRRITYYLDRPDVMSSFVTTISAEKVRYPVLLSNGNKIAEGDVEGSAGERHWVKWEDPFKKPSYLFALVAGDLASVDDSFVTKSGREVALRLFVEDKDIDKCDHAMESLKRAMRWDEEVYGREYDLDIFMIVAVDDFNMGAMENKGLNIFNTSCVLANPKTTTDASFQRVEAVVAHEYFHNWSGNRVTCRDWFQLSLKEGFTVYRDAEFSADMGSRTVKRVEDVAFLQTVQFAEDAGPMAHSIRPESFMEISNFYTVTIYEKGAEVVRMINLLLGESAFRAGSDLYFERHDGQAVTTEEFVKAMEDASGIDLGQFRRWYSQAGTPQLSVSGVYDAAAKTYTLTVKQSCPATPGQPEKLPFHIPFSMGLLSADGTEFELMLSGETHGVQDAGKKSRVLSLTEETQSFVFEGICETPIPSLLRGFSAPVRLNYEYDPTELQTLMVSDSDGFNRWNAGQQLAISIIESQLGTWHERQKAELSSLLKDAFVGVLDRVLNDDSFDRAMAAHLLVLPTTAYLIERAVVADVDAIHGVRESLADQLASALESRFAAVFEANKEEAGTAFSANAEAMARRAIANLSLSYLVRTGKQSWLDACAAQFENATNMTDQAAALRNLVNSPAELAVGLRAAALESFHAQWQHEALVVDQWFAVQATNTLPGALSRVEALMQHADFDIKNPNKVRSLIGAFCGQNHVGFHAVDGSGYRFLADRVIELDRLNPQIASRLLTPLTRFGKFDAVRRELMQKELARIKAVEGLSRDVFEVVAKSTV